MNVFLSHYSVRTALIESVSIRKCTLQDEGEVEQKVKESYHVVIGDRADTRHKDVSLHLSHALCRSEILGQCTVPSIPRLKFYSDVVLHSASRNNHHNNNHNN